MPTLPGSSLCVGELGPAPLDSSNLSLLPHLGPNLDSLGVMEEVEVGSLRPVHPSLSLSRREVLQQPPNGLLPLSGLYPPLPPPSPAGVKTVTVTLAQTTPYTPGALRAETGLTLDIPGRTHTQTQTCTPWGGVGWGWGLTKPYTGQGVDGRVGTCTLHLLTTPV